MASWGPAAKAEGCLHPDCQRLALPGRCLGPVVPAGAGLASVAASGGAFWSCRLGQDHAQASWARKTRFALSAQMAEHDPSRVAGAAGGLAWPSSCLALRATRLAVVASLTMGVMSCETHAGRIAGKLRA
jgi:hypothetical protein